MKTSVWIGAALALAATAGPAPGAAPPATQKIMDAKVSVYDLFVETMCDAMDMAYLDAGTLGMPRLETIAYDAKNDLFVFTFARDLPAAEAEALRRATPADRKERIARAVEDVARLAGLSPQAGMAAPFGVLQLAPVRADTPEMKATGEQMKMELLRRAVAVLLWRAGDLACMAARAQDGTVEYTEFRNDPDATRGAAARGRKP